MVAITEKTSYFFEVLRPYGTIKKFKKGRELFYQGADFSTIFLVLNGNIKLYKITETGNTINFAIAIKDDFVENVPIFKEDEIHEFNAECMTDSEVLCVSVKAFNEMLIEKGNSIVFDLYEYKDTQLKIQTMKYRDAMIGKKENLYSLLIRLTNTYGVKVKEGILIDYPFCYQELGKFISMSREAVNREIIALKNEDVVDVFDRRILVKDLDFLKFKIGYEECPNKICRI